MIDSTVVDLSRLQFAATAMYHFILGMVVGSSVAIFPTVVFAPGAMEKAEQSLPIFLLSCAVMLVLGLILTPFVEDRKSVV